MSIVTALRRNGHITMAADTLALFGEGMVIPPGNASISKIMRIGDALVGGTGWAVYDDILEHFLAGSPTPPLDSRPAIYAFFLEFWKALRETYSLVNDQSASKETPFGDLDATFLIASPGGLFKVSSDLGVTEFRHHHAIGSGCEYALGAMHTLTQTETNDSIVVRTACEAAIAMDVSCGGEVEVVQIDCPDP